MVQFACVGLDHHYIYGMTEPVAAGAKCVSTIPEMRQSPWKASLADSDVPRFESPELLYQREDINYRLYGYSC